MLRLFPFGGLANIKMNNYY